MIANRGRGRMTGASSFGAAINYIVREGPEHERDHAPALAVWSENVATIETAALEMDAVASQSRVKEPLYHLIVSFAEGERPTYEQARAALDTQIRHLDFTGLQYVAALQNDGVGGMYHVHAVFNRVDPVTHVAREVWQDREKMRAASREAELTQGWRVVEVAQRPELSHGARDVEYFEKKRSFERRVREDVGPAIRATIADGRSWAEVHGVLREHGMRYEEVRVNGVVQGGRLVGSERGEYARARDLGPDLTHRKLVEQLGPFDRDQDRGREASPFEERCRAAAAEVTILRGTGDRTDAGWREVHTAFERHGLEYKPYRSGARVGDLDSPQTAKPSEVDRALTLRAMTERFGQYETSAQARDRAAAREAVQRAENLVVGARLLDDPKPLMERLTANNATYTLRAVDRLVAERVLDAEQRQEITQKIVDESVELTDARGKTRFTTREVLAAEQTLATAATGLAAQRRDVDITRPAAGRDGVRLDEQQQRAYAYATDDNARLKVITGVPGAGKTRLINEVATAYAEAGYNVRAVSVANSAVDVLQRETNVPARSVAKELYEWGQDRDRLTNRDLLIIDEVSTLGTAQGAALLHEAHERGAVVIALGDDKQFQAVAHGSALELMQRAVGDRSIDLEKTRRQSEGWQREATEAVRRGEIRAAIDLYRDRGFVHESGSQDEARTALVDRWRAIESTGVECGIEAYTNRERIAINELAREGWRDMGRLAGEDVRLETVDGKVPYAVGDRVIVRETIREAGLINGSVGIVRGIDEATLQIERRDGIVVPVDTREHPGVQHGYCSTEYREQGSTRYAELQLVTEHVNQRSLTVGMTRHTAEYGMFYSREAVGSYDDLVGLGLRTRSKELASDYREVERVQAREAEPVREVEPSRDVTVGELRRELEPIAQGTEKGYTRDERKAAFALLNGLEQLELVAPNTRLILSRDVQQTLRDPGELRAKILQAYDDVVERAHARAKEREQSVEREQSIDRSRGRGRGR
jgi:hypothetical protein